MSIATRLENESCVRFVPAELRLALRSHSHGLWDTLMRHARLVSQPSPRHYVGTLGRAGKSRAFALRTRLAS
jgi:hypothetical protein